MSAETETLHKTWIDKMQERLCKYAFFTGKCEAILKLQRAGYSAEQCLSDLQEAVRSLKKELGEQ